LCIFFRIFSLIVFFIYFFFFSSRRRHTRCLSDWSSDVCSSDLDYYHDGRQTAIEIVELLGAATDFNERGRSILDWGCGPGRVVRHLPGLLLGKVSVYGSDYRSEERRVGKECRCRWATSG